MASRANITIDQGTDWSTTINIQDENGDPFNFSLYTAKAQMRKHFLSSNSLTFNVTLASGAITLSLGHSDAANTMPGRYVYDVELIHNSSNLVSRIVEGTVTLTGQITK